MILIDIYVPSVNSMYDFQFDENTLVANIIDEVSELIGQKEHCAVVGSREELALCHRDSRQILPIYRTLAECGVRTGHSMILV